MEFYAHYDRQRNRKHRLSIHLHNVSAFCELAVSPTVSFPYLPGPAVKKFTSVLGLLHDIGKYTDAFQAYLMDGTESNMKNHAHISAFYAHTFVMRLMEGSADQNTRYAWAFIAYLCVRLHHGNLTLKGLFSNEAMWETLLKQSLHLKEKTSEVFLDLEPGEHTDLYLLSCCPDAVQQLRKEKRLFIGMPTNLGVGRLRKEYWYFALIYLFSVLIDSDKLDSGEITKGLAASVPPDVVDRYLQSKHADRSKVKLDDRRDRARFQMLSVIDSLTENQLRNEHVFIITAPTGIGKTLASLQCALRLQERIREICSYTPRLITAIPFVNIIEQTAKDYQKVAAGHGKLLVHHRLTDLLAQSNVSPNQPDNLEEMPLDRRLLEVESWEADIVLTTFVQLFQSVLTGNNRLLKKVNKLAGSIVILDEIQSLPERYMPLIGALLRKMGQYYGTRFILMTATQPKLLQLGDRLLDQDYKEPIALLRNSQEYFKSMRRTQFIPLLDKPINNEQFVELFQTYREEHQSAVIVVNTIKRSIELFNLLKRGQEEGWISSAAPVFYLSTNIVPMQREQVIGKVKRLLEAGQPVILVSTQTIEAGVDLDFDIGFRDLAPLTSLVQTAGRVNREGRKGEFRPVYITEFEKDSQLIYDMHHMNRTKQLLSRPVEEPDYPQLVDRYYTYLMDEMSFEDSRTLWYEGIVRLDFEKLQQFELIQQLGEVVDVFVELDDKSTKLANAYEKIRQGEWPAESLCELLETSVFHKSNRPTSLYELKAVLKQLTALMGQYMVQVRVKRFLNNRPFPFENRNGVDSDWYWIPSGQIHEFYNLETGFMDETGEAFIY